MGEELIKPLRPLVAAIAGGFRLSVADVGSVGGLHRRWKPLRPILETINFDPLDRRDPKSGETVFPYLLGREAGEARLFVTRRTTMSSTLRPDAGFFAPFWHKPSHVEIVDEISAPARTLDSLLGERGLSPDAIKIDVQGGEAAVLDGAGDTLSRSVLCAEIECSFAARYEGQETADRIIARMRDAGFALFDLRRLKRYRYRNAAGVDDPSLGGGMRAGRLGFGDAIFFLEPDRLWARIVNGGGANGPDMGLKAMLLMLVYNKPDLAAATFDRCAETLSTPVRDAFARFYRSLEGDGGWRQRLHHRIDRWSRGV